MKKYIILLMLIYLNSNMHGQFWPPEIIIDFETSEYQKYINYDPDSGNIWQVGKPQKSILNSGVSSAKAIVTDTVNTYPINIMNSFKINVNFNKNEDYIVPAILFGFVINFDTDSLKDGVKIEYSLNDSIWNNITELLIELPSFYYCASCYSRDDTVISLNSPGYSGFSRNWFQGSAASIGNWIMVEFSFHLPYIQKDSIPVYFKITFASDNIDNNREGCAIDHIEIMYFDGLTEGYEDISTQQIKFCQVYPNPCLNVIQIFSQYDCIHKIEIINLTGKILYKGSFEKTTEVDLTGFNTGIYFIKIKVKNEINILKLLKYSICK